MYKYTEVVGYNLNSCYLFPSKFFNNTAVLKQINHELPYCSSLQTQGNLTCHGWDTSVEWSHSLVSLPLRGLHTPLCTDGDRRVDL